MSSDVKAPSSSKAGASGDDSPFLPGAVNSNPAFNPKKFNANSVEYKLPKPPKPPEKPLMPYMRYSRKIWDSVKRDNKDAKLWEIGKVIGQMWRSLPDADKARYTEEYETEKVSYGESLKSYQNSPAYQQYVAAKERADQKDKEARGKANKFESKVTIQPCDEQEFADDAVLTSRHVAAVRYERNQLLLAEIFSESCVPDLRTVVANGRMATLKKQVHSLNMHQKKLEDELSQLEDKFKSKKRQILESTEAFNASMAKMAKPAIEESKFSQMVERASDDLLARYRMFAKTMEERAKLVGGGTPTLPQVQIVGQVEADPSSAPVSTTRPQSGPTDTNDRPTAGNGINSSDTLPVTSRVGEIKTEGGNCDNGLTGTTIDAQEEGVKMEVDEQSAGGREKTGGEEKSREMMNEKIDGQEKVANADATLYGSDGSHITTENSDQSDSRKMAESEIKSGGPVNIAQSKIPDVGQISPPKVGDAVVELCENSDMTISSTTPDTEARDGTVNAEGTE